MRDAHAGQRFGAATAAHGRSNPAGDHPIVAPRQLRGRHPGRTHRRASGGRRRAYALCRPRGGDRRSQCADGVAARRRGARCLSPAVAFGPTRIMGPAVHAAGDDHRPDHPRHPDHRGADAADHRGLVDRVPRRARGHGCRPARAHRDPDLGRPLQPGHRAARRLRSRGRGGRRHPDRGRQYRRLHPHHDHRDRTRDLEGRPAARDRGRSGRGAFCSPPRRWSWRRSF